MTLKELNETVKYFSEKGHTISHNLAFVGIALAWLFIKTSGEEIVLTKHAYLTIICFDRLPEWSK